MHNELILKCAIYETLLKNCKQLYYHEMKMQLIKNKQTVFKNSKEKGEITRALNESIKKFNDSINRAEKYNNEFSNIIKGMKTLEHVVDASADEINMIINKILLNKK